MNDTTLQPRRAARPLSIRLLAIGLGCVLALVTGELALRVMGYPVVGYLQPDLNLGTRLVPHYRGWQRQEGEVLVTTNSAGWRDREHDEQPKPGVLRIAVLGDSFSEAVQVKIEETWWSLLEQELNAEGGLTGRPVEVLNFGVSGYGTAQEALCLEQEVWKWQPDLVLLQFLPGNDVRNNDRQLEPEQGRPFYVSEAGGLRLDNSFRDAPGFILPQPGQARTWAQWRTSWKHTLVTRSAILSLAYQVRHPADSSINTVEPGIEANVFFPPKTAEWQAAWEVTDRILVMLQQSCHAKGVPLVVCTANNAIQVDPDVKVRSQFSQEFGYEDVLYPDEHLRDVGHTHGFLVIPLTLPMRELARAQGVYFHGFDNTAPGSGHWNKRGHAAAARILRKELQAADVAGRLEADATTTVK